MINMKSIVLLLKNWNGIAPSSGFCRLLLRLPPPPETLEALGEDVSRGLRRAYLLSNQVQARIFLPITKNQLPQYLVSFDPTFRLYRNKLNNHIQRFPEIGSFEVFYRNILVFSKLVSEHFPIVDQLVEIIRRIKEE